MRLFVRIQGRPYKSWAVESTSKEALQVAATDILNQVDLVDNPPPVSKKAVAGLQAKAAARRPATAPAPPIKPKKIEVTDNPIMILHARQTTADAAQGEYLLSPPSEAEDVPRICTLRVVDIDGTLYEAEAQATNKNEAKRPINKKGDMY